MKITFLFCELLAYLVTTCLPGSLTPTAQTLLHTPSPHPSQLSGLHTFSWSAPLPGRFFSPLLLQSWHPGHLVYEPLPPPPFPPIETQILHQNPALTPSC